MALDSTVKRRVVRLAVRQGIRLNDLVETALRQYLTRHRANGAPVGIVRPKLARATRRANGRRSAIG